MRSTHKSVLLAIFIASVSTVAYAQNEQCITIAGYQSSGERQSMDPADQLTSDDTMMIYAVYNRFVNVDDNLEVLPELANHGRCRTMERCGPSSSRKE